MITYFSKKKSKKGVVKLKKMGLTTKIFIGLILGAIFGIILHYVIPAGTFRDDVLINGLLRLFGRGFVQTIQMLVVPLVFASLVSGSAAIGDVKKLGRIGIKTVSFYMVTTAIAITIALLIAEIINPGIGLDLSQVATAEPTIGENAGLIAVLLGIIPTNPVNALASGNMLQIIFFAIFVGIVIAILGEKVKPMTDVILSLNEIMMQMTMLIMKFAPIGVFCLIASTFATTGWDAFVPLLKYMSAVLLGLIVQGAVTYMIMLGVFAKLNPIRFFKNFAPVMNVAFSTASSNATIPVNIETMEERMGVSKSVASFTIPLGATINMDGTAIMQGVAVVFVAQVYGIPLTLPAFLTVILTATLASVGTAGVPGVGLITLSMVLTSVGLPVEGIALIMGIDRILDMARTAVNVTGDAVCTLVVSKSENEFDEAMFYSDNIVEKTAV